MAGALGQLLRAQDRYEEAIPEYQTAIASNPNWVHALHSLAMCKFFTGLLEEVIPLEDQVIRLSPRDPNIGNWYFRIGQVHLLQSRTEESILWFEKARSASGKFAGARASLASAYALKGETERAAAELVEAQQLSADGRYSSIARLRAKLQGNRKVRDLTESTYLVGLRLAGMPEE